MMIAIAIGSPTVVRTGSMALSYLLLDADWIVRNIDRIDNGYLLHHSKNILTNTTAKVA